MEKSQNKEALRIFTGGLDLDMDYHMVEPTDYIDASDVIVALSEDGKVGTVEWVPGNKIVGITLPAGNNTVIGAARDNEDDFELIMVYNDNLSHGIYKIQNETVVPVLQSQYLNFKLEYPIVHIDIVNGVVYWTDNYFNSFQQVSWVNDGFNPPRKLNIQKALNFTSGASVPYNESYHFDTTTTDGILKFQEVLDQIKHPLNAKLYSLYGDDINNQSNFLRRKVFQFSQRYTFDDKEKSIWSTPSELLVPKGEEYINGTFVEDVYRNNHIGIAVQTGTDEVENIELGFRVGNTGFWKVADVFRKYGDDGEYLKRKINSFGSQNATWITIRNSSLNDIGKVYVGMKLNIPNTGEATVTSIDFVNYNVYVSVILLDAFSGEVDMWFESNDEFLYRFYNESPGDFLAQSDVARPFDYVPQIAATQKLIEGNRMLWWNYIEGYDRIDLDIDLWFQYYANDFQANSGIIPVVLLPVGTPGFHIQITIPLSVVPDVIYYLKFYTFPDPYSWGTTSGAIIKRVSYISQVGDDATDVADILAVKCQEELGFTFISVNSPPDNEFFVGINQGSNVWITYTNGEYSQEVDVVQNMKFGVYHNVGVNYYDRAGRNIGVHKSEATKVYNPTFPELIRANKLYTLDAIHNSQLGFRVKSIPPLYAGSYQFALARSSISYFLTTLVTASDITYNTEKTRVFININKDIKSSLDSQNNLNIESYSWKEGDRIRFLYFRYSGAGSKYTYFQDDLDFEVLTEDYPATTSSYESDDAGDYIYDADGNKVRSIFESKIVVNYFDIDSYFKHDPNSTVVVQVYRPSDAATNEDNEIYYEFGPRFPVNDPYTSSRVHGTNVTDQTTSSAGVGYIPSGDTYVKPRLGDFVYPVESPFISDYWKSDSISIGKTSLYVSEAGLKRFIAAARYSGKLFENTLINNLNRVEYDNYDNIEEKYGPVNELDLVGYVLKVRQSRKITSIYIGRDGLEQANLDGKNLVVTSSKVLGTKYVSQDYYGCVDPQSVVVYNRVAYFVDVNNGHIIRDAANGMIAISDLRVKDWVRDICKSMLEDYSSYRILSTYDGRHNLVYFTFEGKNYPKPATYDSYTIVFNEVLNRFTGFFSFKNSNGNAPDYYLPVGGKLYSFMDGVPYIHNDDSVVKGLLYGIQRLPYIKFVINEDPLNVKVFRAIVIQSAGIWYAKDSGDILIPKNKTYTRDTQSKIPKEWFQDREGILYSPFGKNMVTNRLIPNNEDLVNGDELRGDILIIKLTPDTDMSNLFSVRVKYMTSVKSG